jgi:UDP-N-acetylglucosamine--N-acetylmuramyl-(pentapeptide) pyrophosphoryl-undecaprenol N-acetylglucosamine transferase
VKVLIAGGGTGGHIYIGVALARELQRRSEANNFLFVGTRRGLESRIVPQEGFRLEYIDSAGLKGVGIKNLLRSLWLVPQSLLQSRRHVLNHAPDVVVGVGGYSSGPVVLAASWMKKPTLIVEPNAYPGLTNRMLARVVDRAAIALPETAGYFRGKGVLTGIPVRREFQNVPRRQRRRGELVVLIYGGSQGSHALNLAVCQDLQALKAMTPGLRIIHQTGENDLAMVQRAYQEAGIEADIRPFLPRIYEDFGAADLIISRAGASTVAELTVAGKAAILVPFPGATDDHQKKNARALEKMGAARVILQDELIAGRLASEITRYLDHPEELQNIEEAARKIGKPDAAERIADEVIRLANA